MAVVIIMILVVVVIIGGNSHHSDEYEAGYKAGYDMEYRSYACSCQPLKYVAVRHATTVAPHNHQVEEIIWNDVVYK